MAGGGRLTVPVGERDHIRGPVDAPLTLLEYGDYECPYCGAAHPVVEEVREAMGARLRFVYRHFPLSNIHPHAEPAAEAAEAAGAQKRFWPMHDLLFARQDALEPEDLVARAEALGLDVGRFARDLTQGTYRARVREDFMSGVRSGVNGTPTFYVNGVRYEGAPDAGSLLWALERARAA
ncbi:MAG: DsbA family protein [Candidatus Rokubacteria bacterium]|nr:DsbA family protein [Candidatus Rokubacteria bacterium]